MPMVTRCVLAAVLAGLLSAHCAPQLSAAVQGAHSSLAQAIEERNPLTACEHLNQWLQSIGDGPRVNRLSLAF